MLPAAATVPIRTSRSISMAGPSHRVLTEGRSSGIGHAPKVAPSIRENSQPRQTAASHSPAAEASSLSSMATGKKPASASRSRCSTRHGRCQSSSPRTKQAAHGTATYNGCKVNAPPTTAGRNQPPPFGTNPGPTGTSTASAASPQTNTSTNRPRIAGLFGWPDGRSVVCRMDAPVHTVHALRAAYRSGQPLVTLRTGGREAISPRADYRYEIWPASHTRELALRRDAGSWAAPLLSRGAVFLAAGAVPDFEHGAAGRRAVGAVGHAGPTARVVPGPERPPERKVGELAFQQIHLLDIVMGDHADTTGVQTWHPPYEPRKHSRVIGIPGQHLLLRARLLGLLPRHGVRGEELKLPFHPTDS